MSAHLTKESLFSNFQRKFTTFFLDWNLHKPKNLMRPAHWKNIDKFIRFDYVDLFEREFLFILVIWYFDKIELR